MMQAESDPRDTAAPAPGDAQAPDAAAAAPDAPAAEASTDASGSSTSGDAPGATPGHDNADAAAGTRADADGAGTRADADSAETRADADSGETMADANSGANDANDSTTPASGAPRKPDLSPAETAQRLAELFPALFGATPKPIKLRIQADIQARAPGVFSRRVLSFFLGRHTTSTAYIKALLAAEQRFDLDGNPAGEISEEHRSAAKTELERRQQIVQARRAAERAARGGAGRHPAEGERRRPGRPGPPQRRDGAAPGAAGDGRTAGHAGGRAGGRAGGQAGTAAAEPTGAGIGGADRSPRPERGPRPPRGPGGQAGPGAPGGHGPRGGPGHTGGPRPGRGDDRGPRPQPRGEGLRPEAALPQDPAQRERALLLRAWETSPLTKTNFCTLKRLREADFDAQIEQARQERDAARRG